jgi:hypothetical protein
MTVEARRTAIELSMLERAVLEALAYSDVFEYPLTLEETLRALPVEATASEVEAALAADGPLARLTCRVGPFYTLAGRESLVELRRQRTDASAALTRRARRYGSLIASLPFVRMVAVTGSLAVDNAGAGDDVDYLIVTAKGRVWLARALTMLVVRLARIRGLTLCPNYVLSEAALLLPERDVYTARELLQMRPVAGRAVYSRMLAVNAWSQDLLPNWRVEIESAPAGRSMLANLGERLLGGRLGDALERRLLRHKGAELRAQAGDNSEAVFTQDICKGHFDAHRARLQAQMSRRLRQIGLEP